MHGEIILGDEFGNDDLAAPMHLKLFSNFIVVVGGNGGETIETS